MHFPNLWTSQQLQKQKQNQKIQGLLIYVFKKNTEDEKNYTNIEVLPLPQILILYFWTDLSMKNRSMSGVARTSVSINIRQRSSILTFKLRTHIISYFLQKISVYFRHLLWYCGSQDHTLFCNHPIEHTNRMCMQKGTRQNVLWWLKQVFKSRESCGLTT